MVAVYLPVPAQAVTLGSFWWLVLYLVALWGLLRSELVTQAITPRFSKALACALVVTGVLAIRQSVYVPDPCTNVELYSFMWFWFGCFL